MTEDHAHDDPTGTGRAHGQLEQRLRGALQSWLDPLEPPPPRAPVSRARMRAPGLGVLGTIAAVLVVAALIVGPRLAGELGGTAGPPAPLTVQPGVAAAPSPTPGSASSPLIGSAPCLAAGASGALCGATVSSATPGGVSNSTPASPSATASVPAIGHGTATPATHTLRPIPSPTPAASPTSLPTPGPPTASPTPADTAPSSQPSTVTLADNGETLHLRVGGQFLLDLGLTYDWTVNVADQQVVSRVPNILVIRGAQGIYEARAAGTTTLSAAGNPACLSAKPPCAMPSLLFRLQIVVS